MDKKPVLTRTTHIISTNNALRTPNASPSTQTATKRRIPESTSQIITKAGTKSTSVKLKATTSIGAKTSLAPEKPSSQEISTEYRYVTWTFSTIRTIKQNASDINTDHKKAYFGNFYDTFCV